MDKHNPIIAKVRRPLKIQWVIEGFYMITELATDDFYLVQEKWIPGHIQSDILKHDLYWTADVWMVDNVRHFQDFERGVPDPLRYPGRYK